MTIKEEKNRTKREGESERVGVRYERGNKRHKHKCLRVQRTRFVTIIR